MNHPEGSRRILSLTRRNLFIPVVFGSVSLLLILLMLMLLSSNKSNRTRYQTENYERYKGNLQTFESLIRTTDTLCHSIEKQSLYGAPFVANASSEELESNLLSQKNNLILTQQNPFIANTSGYSLYSQLQLLASANSNLSSLIIYAPKSSYSIGVRAGGLSGWVARNDAQMKSLCGLSFHPAMLKDETLLFSNSTEYIKEGLHVVRTLENSLILIIGFSDTTVEKNLLYANCGRSYAQLQMAMRLPDGNILQMPASSEEETLSAEELFSGTSGVRKTRGITVMELINDMPAYSLSVALRETGATDPASSRLFLPFLLLNGLWLIIVSAVCIYVTVYLARPLRQYNQQLQDQQTTIDQQRLQLRRAYLFRLMLGENIAAVPTDELESLLSDYVLMVIYPENGRWVDGEGSIQELEYQSHIVMFSMRETLHALLKDQNPEFVICGVELVAILSAAGQTDEEIWAHAEKGLLTASQECGQNFRFGISRIHHGAENMEHAYRAARRKLAALSEEHEERSENVNLGGLLKPNMHMANLIYVEKYNEAWNCFQETLETLDLQKSKSLRHQQISSFVSLTLCMLLETNPQNDAILSSIGMDKLKDISSINDLKSNWHTAFVSLDEQHEDKNLGQYSAQFTVIYQYVQAHFRNPELSLSFLSEEFGLSLSTLSREFQKNLGEGFLDCLHRLRVDAARHEIEYSSKTIADVAISVGYSNTLTMTRAFKKYLGSTPGAFRK